MGTSAELLGRKGTDRRPDPSELELPGAAKSLPWLGLIVLSGD